MNFLLFISLAFAVAAPTNAGDIAIEPGKQLPETARVRVRSGDDDREVTIPYLLFVPQTYETAKNFPLLLFLHGSGESGNGGDELDRVKTNGPPKIVEHRPDFPFIVVSPQHPPVPESEEDTAWNPQELVALIDHVCRELKTDNASVYATGLSMGGYGVWQLAAAHPNHIAAAISVSGGGDPATLKDGIGKTSVWAFHGAKDTVVPLAEEQAMVDAAKHAGGDVRFTIYPDAGHDAWTETYNNQQVYDWLLAHRLADPPRRWLNPDQISKPKE
jgi:predicted peptidase